MAWVLQAQAEVVLQMAAGVDGAAEIRGAGMLGAIWVGTLQQTGTARPGMSRTGHKPAGRGIGWKGCHASGCMPFLFWRTF